MTEDYLESLARQGDRAAFDRALANVPAVPPIPGINGTSLIRRDPAGNGRKVSMPPARSDAYGPAAVSYSIEIAPSSGSNPIPASPILRRNAATSSANSLLKSANAFRAAASVCSR